MNQFKFTFRNLENYLKDALDAGYSIMGCADYFILKDRKKKILVLRVDVDESSVRSKRIALLLNNLQARATFFFRLHAVEYNIMSFENYRTVRFIHDSGHEVGYHSEIIDQSAIWNEPADKCLIRDLKAFELLFGIKIKGVASHGGKTGLNNLDFWKSRKPQDYGLLYEAYDGRKGFGLFKKSFYVSDSNYRWKCYSRGTIVSGDSRNLGEHVKDGHLLIYCNIHPEHYFDEHIYE